MTDQDRLKSDGQGEQRGVLRIGVLRGAKIVLGEPGRGHSIIDCIVANTSPTGVRVRTSVFTPVPEWVTLEFPDGTTSHAHRCWARGLEMGFDLSAGSN